LENRVDLDSPAFAQLYLKWQNRKRNRTVANAIAEELRRRKGLQIYRDQVARLDHFEDARVRRTC
jgi:predicted AAA+ superfamily ATPase